MDIFYYNSPKTSKVRILLQHAVTEGPFRNLNFPQQHKTDTNNNNNKKLIFLLLMLLYIMMLPHFFRDEKSNLSPNA